MALAHTILALLAKRPGSGYDISKHFDEGISCYWKATQQQVYRELGKLKTQGWVNYETLPQDGKPDKKLYQITEAGWAELARWYGEPTEPTPIREDLLVKVLIGHKMPRAQLEKELRHRQQLHTEKLAFYREKEAGLIAVVDQDVEMQFMHLTLKRGIAYEISWLTWCEDVMAVLEKTGSNEAEGPAA
ncbi:MAG: PadR family transcriptional regulator [Cyanobacteria bacterium J06614_10]